MKLTASNASITNTVVSSSLTLGNNAVVESLSVGNVSINSSAIAVGNTSITPAAISTPSLILGGTAFSGGLFGGIVDYQEFTANGTWYNPYANASANAFLTGYEQVFVMAWGGGGGGASNNTVRKAAGGGSCALGYYTLSSLANTLSVTIGLGGTASRTTTTSIAIGGGAGGNTVFGSLTVYGGGGTADSTGPGGGGGGILGVGVASGSSGTGGAPLGGATAGGVSTFGGGGGGNASTTQGGESVFGGGGGAYSTFSATVVGGNSVFGGGGGSIGNSANSGGASVFGGIGGAGGFAGSIPGGGGGSNTSSASAGARGEVRVWVIGPGSTTAGEPTYALTANTTTLYEGSDVLYTVSTTNIANNTTLYYTLNNSSTATSADFTTAVNGSVIITSGTGTFTLTAADDADSANEAFQIDVRTNSTSGSIVASNGSVSVVPVVYANATFIASNTRNFGTLTTSYTLTNFNVGSNFTDKVLVVAIGHASGSLDGGSGSDTITGVTVNGSTATKLVDRYVSGTSAAGAAIYAINTISTSTANVVISGRFTGLGIGIYNVRSITGITPNSTNTVQSGSTSGGTASIDLTGTAFIAVSGSINESLTGDWSNVTQNFEADVGSDEIVTAAFANTASPTTLTVTRTEADILVGAAWQ